MLAFRLCLVLMMEIYGQPVISSTIVSELAG